MRSLIQTEFPKGYLNQTYDTFREAFKNAKIIASEESVAGMFSAPECLTRLIQDVGRFAESYASDLFYDLKPVWYLMQGVLPKETGMDEIYVFGIRRNGVSNGPQAMAILMEDVGPYQPYLHPYMRYRKILALKTTVYQNHGEWQICMQLADITDSLIKPEKSDLDGNGKLKTLEQKYMP